MSEEELLELNKKTVVSNSLTAAINPLSLRVSSKIFLLHNHIIISINFLFRLIVGTNLFDSRRRCMINSLRYSYYKKLDNKISLEEDKRNAALLLDKDFIIPLTIITYNINQKLIVTYHNN